MNSNTHYDQNKRAQTPMGMPVYAESHITSPSIRGPQTYFMPPDRDPPKGQHQFHKEQRSYEPAPPTYQYHDAKDAAHHHGYQYGNPYPSPPAPVVYMPSGAIPQQSPYISQQIQQPYQSQQVYQAQSIGAASATVAGGQSSYFSQPIAQQHQQSAGYLPRAQVLQQQKNAPSHLPPPPKGGLPAPPPNDPAYQHTIPFHPEHRNSLSLQGSPIPPVSPPFPAPPAHRYNSSPVPGSFQSSSMYSAGHNIDTAEFSLHTSLSSLSLASLGHQEPLHRVASNASSNTKAQQARPMSIISTKVAAPMTRTVMELKTAEALASLPFEDIPRCYVVAPPVVAGNSSGAYTPFRILAPCQGLGVRDQTNQIHFPDHQGYAVNRPEEIMKKHGTVLQHMANMAWLVSGASEATMGKNLAKHAEKFLRNVKPSTRVPALKDTIQNGTAVDGTSVQIEAFMVDHLHLESYSALLQDITGSSSSSDWSCGLQRIVSPGTGRNMWVCDDCFRGMQSGKYIWNDEQASLDDLIAFPDRSGQKSEAHVHNSIAVDVYTQMIKKQSRMKSALLHLSPAYFEHPDRKTTATFAANQQLLFNLTKTLTEAHLTIVEINGNQARESAELMDKDNIYLHLRRIFACFSIEVLKLTGFPFLLREKLPGFLNHAKCVTFEGVLVDNDKAVANMKKIITENSDMEVLSLTRAHMTGSGLKVLCGAHKNLRRLTRLDLSYNRLDGEGIKELASQVMSTSLDFRFLDLSENPNIGSAGCTALLKAIWPPSLHGTRQKNLVALQLANTGFCDDSALFMAQNIDKPEGIGALYNINVSGNLITKPGLVALMSCAYRAGSSSSLRRLLLSQQTHTNSLPASMDGEIFQMVGNHPSLTHLSLSKISFGIAAEIINVNKTLISFQVDDLVLTSPQDTNYALVCFNSLCQGLSSNPTLQDLKIRLPWSFWTLAYQGMGKDMEGQWEAAAAWMEVLENNLRGNLSLRSLQMRGVTNFEEELMLAAVVSSGGSIASGISGGRLAELAKTEGEMRMVMLGQAIRRLLERNQVMHYGRKHGLEAKLIAAF
ncbi:hypothetical protein BGZ95_011217 [Linnemannia exigua]|uniref:RNI-like protein n=1 Tax=Linnemannia exigua TaxID=604196 RepID=A0AAD4H5F3_9FUNG|nr:hypothetical protein BGZ95_011217 [Linnemannia exigua]